MLGRKEGEKTVRFPGGFVDGSDTSLEHAARRECHEETGVTPDSLEYLGSFVIPDGRMGSGDTMLSAFFLGHVIQGGPIQANDDLERIDWIPVRELRNLNWHPHHAPMFEALCRRLEV